jgi:hypothetical protein
MIGMDVDDAGQEIIAIEVDSALAALLPAETSTMTPSTTCTVPCRISSPRTIRALVSVMSAGRSAESPRISGGITPRSFIAGLRSLARRNEETRFAA